MFTRPKLRFSLLSLLLVTTLVGVGVSHWLTTRRLRNAEAKSREQRQIIRGLNDELKRLTVDDPAQIHVMASRDSWCPKSGGSAVLNMGWQIYLPGKPLAKPEWRLCWSLGDIPATGFPANFRGEAQIETGLDSQITISMRIAHHRSTGCTANFEFGEHQKTYFIPDDQADWLEGDDHIEFTSAGQRPDGDARAIATESFAPDGPIVLLRQRRMLHTGNAWAVDPLATQGVMVWLERISKK